MSTKRILTTLLLGYFLCSCAKERKIDQQGIKLESSTPDRMEWWREAKFGMFIHWGIYSEPGGEWKGEMMPKSAEWMLFRGQLPIREYMSISEKFNPQGYDPEEWVKSAKNAGMKYIVLTTKHHDGFALFPSKANSFNIMDATPYKKDIIKMFVEACRKYDMKIGFYYSHAIDWTHPGGAFKRASEPLKFWDETYPRGTFSEYMEQKAIPQLKEILSNYGKIDILWWDTPWGDMNEEFARQFQQVVDSLQPGILTNNRLLKHTKGFEGDFQTPERYIPPTGLDYDWETCLPTNTSWGYKKNDNNWKSEKELIQKLAIVASQGGNLLLNFGPKGDGKIPEEGISILKSYAGWMKVNSESIYATQKSPFHKLFWGVCTQKTLENGNTRLYFHVFDLPSNGKISINGMENTMLSARYLDGGGNVPFELHNGNWVLNIGDNLKHEANTVIVVEIEGTPKVLKNIPEVSGNTTLKVAFADIVNKSYRGQAYFDEPIEDTKVVDLKTVYSKLVWGFNLNLDSAKFRLEPKGDFPDTTTWRVDLIDRTFFITKNKNDELAEFKGKGLQLLTVRPAYNQTEPISLSQVNLKME